MIKKTSLIQLIVLLSISVAAMIAYLPSINAGYFSDDYHYKFHDTKISVTSILAPTHNYAYRPVEKAFLMILQHQFPTNTWPIHISHLILHLLFSIFLMIWMRRQGFSRFSSILTFGIMALSQANSHAISSLDTFSQITGTFLGYSSVALFSSYLQSQTRSRHFLYLFSFLLSVIALFCKESAMFVVPTVGAISFLYSLKHHHTKPLKIARSLVSFVPFMIASVGFLLLRKHMNLIPVEIGPDRLNIGFGINIIINFIMLIMQIIQPHASVSVVLDLMNMHWTSIAATLFFSGILFIVTIRGILNSKYRIFSMLLISMVPLSMFPIILLNHISELYAYNTIPLIAIFYGIGLGELYAQLRSRMWKVSLLSLVSVFLIWNTSSVFYKCKLVKQNGLEAEKLISEIQPYFLEIPDNGNLILVNPNTSSKTEYSIFKRTGFRLFEAGTEEFGRRAGRNDFQTSIIMEKDLNSIDLSNSLVLRYHDGNVIKVDH